MDNIKLDLNYTNFQEQLFALEKIEQRALLNTLRKIKQLNWDDLYQDKGIRWELITSRKTKKGNNIYSYSFRFSQKYCSAAYRDDEFLVMLNLFVDHDSTYK